jgi:hypothetical protein
LNLNSPRSGFSFLSTPDGIILYGKNDISLLYNPTYQSVGGYCKEYAKGKRPIGIMLEDTWLLRSVLLFTPRLLLPTDCLYTVSLSLATPPEGSASSKTKFEPLIVKWERRKRPSTAYAPALRSGATMALWATKGIGVMFGGVTDEDSDEETLKSVFWSDL